VLTLLQTIGKTPRKHKGALTLFDTEFIKTGLLPEELSATLHRLFDARQEDDYRRVDPVLLEEATEFITVAEGFVHSIREYLRNMGYLSNYSASLLNRTQFIGNIKVGNFETRTPIF
jgi:uncharacterized protein (UPF0332 family)